MTAIEVGSVKGKSSNNGSNIRGSKKRKTLFSLGTFFIVLLSIFLLGELMVRVFRPQSYMYPRYKYSEKYGRALYENSTMIHELPGEWKYKYSINEHGHRGKSIPISNVYTKSSIIILGDSNSMGVGVDDEEVYSEVMSRQLTDYNIINLSCGGWGLTQQIRRYYEFGKLYDPDVVILQFAANDPTDNLVDKVTLVEKGRFRFRNTEFTEKWINKYLSHSVIQKSAVYNFFRPRVYRWFHKKRREKAIAEDEAQYAESHTAARIKFEESFYNELLLTFANDLHENGVRLIMISVNGHVDRFKHIKNLVAELDTQGVLDYLEVVSWFEGKENFHSPQGHRWGGEAHKIIGTNLAKFIKVLSETKDE